MEKCNNGVTEILVAVGIDKADMPPAFFDEAAHIGEERLLEKLGFVKTLHAPNHVSYLLVENGPTKTFFKADSGEVIGGIVARYVPVPFVDKRFFGELATKKILKARVKEWKSVIKD